MELSTVDTLSLFNGTLEQVEDEDLPLLYLIPKMAIPYLVAVGIAMSSGVFGNLFILAMVFCKKTLRPSGYEFMVNLALADFCVTGIADPLCILGVTHGRRWFAQRPWLCDAVASLCLTACFCSFLSLIFVSFNRYLFIVHNEIHHRLFSKSRAGIMCVLVWMMAFTMEMGNFIGWGDHYFDPKSHQCIWDRTASKTYTLFVVATMAVGLTMMLGSYAAIFAKVWKSKIELLNFNEKKEEGNDKTWAGFQQALTMCRMMFVVVLVFGVCWLPYLFVISYDLNDSLGLWVHLWVTYVAHLHAAVNWIVYCFTNPVFGKTIKRAFRLSSSSDKSMSSGTVSLSHIKMNLPQSSTSSVSMTT